MKIITAVSVFEAAMGLRMSAVYSEVDDETGRILSDNNRFDRVVLDKDIQAKARELLSYAGTLLGE